MRLSVRMIETALESGAFQALLNIVDSLDSPIVFADKATLDRVARPAQQ